MKAKRINVAIIAAWMAIQWQCSLLAQWKTETVHLEPGWNGVFLHVGATHTTLNDMIGASDIEEVWLWTPTLTSLQFVTSPNEPLPESSNWLVWKRDFPLETTLTRLMGNAAYLVKLDPVHAGAFDWNILGTPVPPKVYWNSDGINLFGFSTVPINPPDFEAFFTHAPSLLANASVYKYGGGELTNNPNLLPGFHTTPGNPADVNRGEAFWISDSTTFNRYFGPFELILQDQSGVHFDELTSTYTLRIRNTTSTVITVTLSAVASEAAPDGEDEIAGQVPVLVRHPLNPETLTYPFIRLSESNAVWNLNPKGHEGSEMEVVLGLDRANLGGTEQDFFAGILRFTDNLGYTQVDMPVSAIKASRTGLWVGQADVSQVRHDLTFYDRASETPQQTGSDVTLGSVLRTFPLRLIVHAGATGEPQLLQRVYYGFDAFGLPLLTKDPSLLNSTLYKESRRISAVHLPWTESNLSWPLTGGSLQTGQTVSATVTTGANDHASNPFLHTYHPDHDNLNATFDAVLSRGAESYDIVRNISLTFETGGETFANLTVGGDVLSGTYQETVTLLGSGSESKEYATQGTFSLRRMLFEGELAQAP